MYRPLSPHILVYKPRSSSIFSVFHRVTGVILTLGMLAAIFAFKFFLEQAGQYPVYVMGFYLNTYGGWMIAGIFCTLVTGLVYHFWNGIRHLLGDFYPETFLDKTNDSGQYISLISAGAISLTVSTGLVLILG